MRIKNFEKRLYFLDFPALPNEEGLAKPIFRSYTSERKFAKWFTKSLSRALPNGRFFENGCKNRIFLLYPLRDIFENIALVFLKASAACVSACFRLRALHKDTTFTAAFFCIMNAR